MPLFEYRCTRCHHQFEALVRDSASPDCPQCHAKRPERLLSTVSARVSGVRSLPVSPGCPPSDAPPCGPGCCRLQ
ncbi:MAG TPA: zinc ribbon domain-containing protein [Planctomycetaceae bacterium]|nr:zinc ribbon domain-containing protein [Planctomycetaceae bacterium]